MKLNPFSKKTTSGYYERIKAEFAEAKQQFEEAQAAANEAKADAEGQDGPTLTVRQRLVTTGATRGDLIAVTEGLKPGERVATSGLLKLRNDAVVTINNRVQPAADEAPRPENR